MRNLQDRVLVWLISCRKCLESCRQDSCQAWWILSCRELASRADLSSTNLIQQGSAPRLTLKKPWFLHALFVEPNRCSMQWPNPTPCVKSLTRSGPSSPELRDQEWNKMRQHEPTWNNTQLNDVRCKKRGLDFWGGSMWKKKSSQPRS